MAEVWQATVFGGGRPRFGASVAPLLRPEACRRGRCLAARHRGVTLLELLLVLAVLALLGMVAWPALDRSFADQRLRNAADMVRAQWTQSQVRAVASGTVYYFRNELGGRYYWLESAEDADVASGALSSSSSPLSAGAPAGASLLPEDVTFGQVTVEAATSCDALDAYGQSTAGDSTAVGSSLSGAAIAFYPDGSCSSARLVLRNTYDRCIAVSLQGLTGLASVSDVFTSEDAGP